MTLHSMVLSIICFPLIGGLLAGLGGRRLSAYADYITISGVGVAFILACRLFKTVIIDATPATILQLYTWGISGAFHFDVSVLVDPLSVMMLIVVTFVSLLVHIYSIGYMHDDPGYARFFSYISLFTFSMLVLVLANNFMLLFFGWESVGLISYLLIGFWFSRESANQGSMKAFIVNRVGDFGFLLAIAAIFTYCGGSLDYSAVFAAAPGLSEQTLPGSQMHVATLICLLLFVGAMGKSAQVPLHVWLPESMEGPTPISALIHAATMVTAGIYLIARLSPLFEYSTTARTVILVVGATGALFLGLLALVQHDIKRVVAYSTLSQLGYMMAALGASAYAAGLFHLFTHAFFKALMFLAAGSVILALHHEQDMRKMGGLYKKLPITYTTFLIAALALTAIPPFAGFYSKDMIIAAVGTSHLWGSQYAYSCVLLGSFITALYTFRAVFLVFHGTERHPHDPHHPVHESPWVVCLPLILLAVPSVMIGAWLVGPLVLSPEHWFGTSIFVRPEHAVMTELAMEYKNAWSMLAKAPLELPFWFAISGIGAAYLLYSVYPKWPRIAASRLVFFYHILLNTYGFDAFNNWLWVRGTKRLAESLYQQGDVKIIDSGFVLGSGRCVLWASALTRRLQSGYLYHYAFTMLAALMGLLAWFSLRHAG